MAAIIFSLLSRRLLTFVAVIVDRFGDLIGQVQCFNDKLISEFCTPSQLIERVFEPVIFVAAFIPGVNPAKHDGTVRQLGHLVRFNNDATAGEIDRQGLRLPVPTAGAGLHERANQP